MQKIVAVILIAILSLDNQVQASLGVDLSVAFDNFSCLKSQGVEYAITRAWKSYGELDKNASVNIINARNAGIKNVYVYMFPCRGKNAQEQVHDMLTQIQQAALVIYEQKSLEDGVQHKYNDADQYFSGSKVWLDIETNPSSGCGWGTDYQSNCEYVKELVDALNKNQADPGIYTSQYMWEQIMGSIDACKGLSNLPLWYAHYDGKSSFSDYIKISNWSSPFMKQYAGDQTKCNVGVDLNYFE